MSEQCDEPGCEMLAGHAGEWHSGQLSNAVVDTEPATRPEPGTPLPWSATRAILSCEWLVLDSQSHGVAVTDGPAFRDAGADGRYIVYAANKLPEIEADCARLVATLQLAELFMDRGLASIGPGLGETLAAQRHWQRGEARDHVHALLAELEEERADG